MCSTNSLTYLLTHSQQKCNGDTPDFIRVQRLGLMWAKFICFLPVNPDPPAVQRQIKLFLHLTTDMINHRTTSTRTQCSSVLLRFNVPVSRYISWWYSERHISTIRLCTGPIVLVQAGKYRTQDKLQIQTTESKLNTNANNAKMQQNKTSLV